MNIARQENCLPALLPPPSLVICLGLGRPQRPDASKVNAEDRRITGSLFRSPRRPFCSVVAKANLLVCRPLGQSTIHDSTFRIRNCRRVLLVRTAWKGSESDRGHQVGRCVSAKQFQTLKHGAAGGHLPSRLLNDIGLKTTGQLELSF